MPGSPAPTKDHVGLPIPDILANISQEGAHRVFVAYLQRTTPESQYLVGDAHDADCAIVACSGAWLERCGYGEDEVIGRGCRHLLRGRRRRWEALQEPLRNLYGR